MLGYVLTVQIVCACSCHHQAFDMTLILRHHVRSPVCEPNGVHDPYQGKVMTWNLRRIDCSCPFCVAGAGRSNYHPVLVFKRGCSTKIPTCYGRWGPAKVFCGHGESLAKVIFLLENGKSWKEDCLSAAIFTSSA